MRFFPFDILPAPLLWHAPNLHDGSLPAVRVAQKLIGTDTDLLLDFEFYGLRPAALGFAAIYATIDRCHGRGGLGFFLLG